MTVDRIFKYLKELAPLELAMDYDNPGFLVGDIKARVTKAVVALDCTKGVIAKAKELGAELIITHHPVIFDPLKSVTNLENKRIFDLVSSGIAVISMHTNLDVATGGVNDCLATALGLTRIETVLDPEGFAFRRGILPEAMSADGFAKYIKSCLGGVVRYVEGDKPIKTVAVCGGSGGSMLETAAAAADAFVTADVKHSMLIKANEMGFSLFDAGHFHTENTVVEPLSQNLSAKFSDVEFYPLNLKEIRNI